VIPDEHKQTKSIPATVVDLIQDSQPAGLKDEKIWKWGINRVTLIVEWIRGGRTQSKRIEFYVYRL
jgi:hypothetical protein